MKARKALSQAKRAINYFTPAIVEILKDRSRQLKHGDWIEVKNIGNIKRSRRTKSTSAK